MNSNSGGHDFENHTWGAGSGHASEIVAKIKAYLKRHEANYEGQVDTLLELMYEAYMEYNSVETTEFKSVIDPLDQALRSLIGSDGEADAYLNAVYKLCAAYERQSYIEGIKAGARLMMELMG